MFGLFISCGGVVCGQFRFFVYTQSLDHVLPGQDPVTEAGRQWTPQHFPNVHTGSALFYTSNPHPYAQQADKKFLPVKPVPLTVSRMGRSCVRCRHAATDMITTELGSCPRLPGSTHRGGSLTTNPADSTIGVDRRGGQAETCGRTNRC